ncbi:hypothetical protein SAMN02799631_04331 [Methylobacterium sp. 174MFSha1.1]|uniref:hypothetical protein n=1 Tax=Methylobacterium sp. 174MFSha1.1 TaxID=1502749 RepID=UPI0008EBCAF3|nr:hypothetical protein [Methylobacterium sp. 174MFSha1.1]SFV05982.1 hypothetical protein SAMN02799631_04331 [Methylobacterium sp. 174MFSha1.1]
MPRLISLNARKAAHAQQTDQIPVMLATIRHIELPEPVYLSSDNTERITDEPLVYGTRHQGHTYLFVQMGAVWPDDQRGSAPKSTLVFENVTPDMAKPLRAVLSPASVDLTIVMAETPDVIEARYLNLKGTLGTWDASAISLDVGRETFANEPCPSRRVTKACFPGVFR